MLKRNDYLEKILPLIDKDIIKVLTGIRRSGKSTILAQIVDELIERGVKSSNILFMNFDSAEFQNILDKDDFNEYVASFITDDEKYYLFFDEVQNVSGWERSLSGFIVDYNVDIYVTGSNANLLSGELATYLTGRYMEFKIYPFSFKEVRELYKQREIEFELNDLFMEYITWGGMPFIFNLDNETDKKMYLEDIYNSIVFKDVLRRANINKVDFLDKLIRFVIMNIGHPFSSNSLSKYLKNKAKRHSKSETIYNYLKYFENACFVHRVFREKVMGKEILKTNEKFYLTDHGFRQGIYGNNIRDINLVLENIVYMELLRRGYDVTVGSIAEKEIDFLAKKDGKKIYFQVSYIIAEESTRKREFAPLLKIRDNYPKYVLSTDSAEYDYEGIGKKTVINFLLEDDWEI